MIKKIKNFICKLLGIKQCACPEEDEHIEYYTKTPEPEIPIYKEHCDDCPKYKHRCPKCKEAIA